MREVPSLILPEILRTCMLINGDSELLILLEIGHIWQAELLSFIFFHAATNGSVPQTGDSSYARDFLLFSSLDFHIQVQRSTDNTTNMYAMQCRPVHQQAWHNSRQPTWLLSNTYNHKHYFAPKNNIKVNDVSLTGLKVVTKNSHHFLKLCLVSAVPSKWSVQVLQLRRNASNCASFLCNVSVCIAPTPSYLHLHS